MWATGDGRRPPRRSPKGASPQGVGKDRGWVRSHEVGDEARNPRRAGDLFPLADHFGGQPSGSRHAAFAVSQGFVGPHAGLARPPSKGAVGHALSFKAMGVGFAAERRRGPAWKQAGSCRRDRAGSSCSGSDLTRRGGSQDPLRRPLHSTHSRHVVLRGCASRVCGGGEGARASAPHGVGSSPGGSTGPRAVEGESSGGAETQESSGRAAWGNSRRT